MAKQISKGIYRVNATTLVGQSEVIGLNVGDPSTPWTSLCETHNESLGHETRNLALSHAATSAKAGWCVGCRESAPSVGRSEDFIEVIGVPKATAKRLAKAIIEKAVEDRDEIEVRTRREIDGDSFKGKRWGDSYLCPQHEEHGPMVRLGGDMFRCEVRVSDTVTRACSTWSGKDLNPQAAHFVVEVLS